MLAPTYHREVGELFDHHIHSDRSDGTVSLQGRAKTVSVRPHGVSDHYPWKEKMRDDDDVLRYLDDAARLGLRVGLEFDLGVAPSLRPSTRDALHYVIGAVHQVEVAPGEWIRYDDAGAFLKGRVHAYGEAQRYLDADLQRRIRERTLEVVREGIETERIDILGRDRPQYQTVHAPTIATPSAAGTPITPISPTPVPSRILSAWRIRLEA